MSVSQLPAQAANLLRATGSTATCTSTQVESLKLLLLPATPALVKKSLEKKTPRQTSRNPVKAPSKPKNSRAKKPPAVTIHEGEEEASRDSLGAHDKALLATEIINVTLKSLTLAIKNSKAPQTPRTKRRSLIRSSSSASYSGATTPVRCSTPLQPISVNTVHQSPARFSHLKRSSSGSCHGSNSTRSQAECARISLACLRDLQSLGNLKTSLTPLQLETAMSALISKFLALEYNDLALKELRLLKRRIEMLALGQNAGSVDSTVNMGTPLKRMETQIRDESLSDLLKYTTSGLSGPLLALVITSQLQAIKIIAQGGDATSIEAAYEHVRLEVAHSPATLIGSQIDAKDPMSRNKAAHQLETLAQTLMRLCPSASRAVDKSAISGAGPSAQTAFAIQSLALQIRMRWWHLSDHQPNCETELIRPMSRYLSAYHRRCKSVKKADFSKARDSCNLVLAELKQRRKENNYDTIAIFATLARMAFESDQHDDALQWIRLGLDNLKAVGSSPSRRSALLCQLATSRLRGQPKSLNDDLVIRSLRDASSSLEGDLRGESVDLDELLFAMANLRKSAFLCIQDEASAFNPNEILLDTSGLGECTKFLLGSARFLIRYIGSEPSSGKNDSKLSRFSERKTLATQAGSSTIEPIIKVARLSAKSDAAVWLAFDAGLRDCHELAKILYPEPLIAKGNNAARSTLPHVALSEAHWFRFLALKSIGTEPKLLLRPLQKSIDILRSRSCEEKVAGCLPMKLQKYGILCETLHDNQGARDHYEEAIRLSIDAGTLDKIEDAARLAPWNTVVTTNRDFEIFSRSLHALSKAALSIKDVGSVTRIFLDPDWLPSGQRGLILEQQLFSALDMSLGHSHSALPNTHLNLLAGTVLLLYDQERYPIRRLHVVVQLLHLLSIHPNALESSLVSTLLLTRANEQSSKVVDTFDKGLRQYITHSSSCLEVYLSLRGGDADFQVLEAKLSDWCKLLRRFPAHESLTEYVYDISAWLEQLEVISCYLKSQGHDTLRTAVLHLIVAVREGQCSTQCLDLISGLIELGIHYTRLGYSGPGGISFDKAQRFLAVSNVPTQLMLDWYLVKAEHMLTEGTLDKCRDFLCSAAEAIQSAIQSPKQSIKSRTGIARSAANLMLIQSRFFAEQGCQPETLFFARASVQEYQRIWGSIERQNSKNIDQVPSKDVTKGLAESLSELSISNGQMAANPHSKWAALETSAYWNVTPNLFESFLHLSQCFAHNGLLLEAQYYLAQSQKIADVVHNPSMMNACLALEGRYAIRRGSAADGLAKLEKMSQNMSDRPHICTTIKTRAMVAFDYIKAGKIDTGLVACTDMIDRLRGLTLKPTLDHLIYKEDTESLSLQMSGMKLEDSKQVPSRKGRVPQKKANAKSCVQPSGPSSSLVEIFHQSDVVPLNDLRIELLLIKALAKSRKGDLAAALSQLDDQHALPQRQQHVIKHALLRSQVKLHQGLQHLVGDPIFSVLPESSICCPATVINHKAMLKGSPKVTKSTKTASSRALCKPGTYRNGGDGENYEQSLSVAHRCLLETLKIAVTFSSTADVHEISETLGKILTMLSALPGTETKGSRSSQFMAYILELGREVAVNREMLSTSIERQVSQRRDPEKLPSYIPGVFSNDVHRDLSFDFSDFQEHYINVIPKSWQVISLTLSESHEEIWVSKIRPGQTPFVLRLPFNRENAADGDTEDFSFDEGRSEMLNIIQMANTSAHNGRDVTGKGAKTAWWDNRASLDARLTDLLANIESIWFGGFRGIFSPSMPEPNLLARFQQSFQNNLDKHLPSRQAPGKNKQVDKIVLDPRVLELFVALGPPGETNDIDEQLMDLLYFVVDILQFNKERNAYDEIDFDAIVIETVDALKQYHQAVGTDNLDDDIKHTILILDRQLHGFPWESLPCTIGQPISRLPSIGCLRRRILQMRKEQAEKATSEESDAVKVNPNQGAYILNPGGDLVNTQALLGESLQSLTHWESFVEREPTETDMKNCLQDKKLFLYFGHGSGRQYIRPRTIKKLEQCAVALLMGCSSGTLTEAGEYEAYGTPMDYMQAGCPALLATLWDVTDKDIDRFSMEVLQKWGLFREPNMALTGSPTKKSTKQKGKMKVGAKELIAERKGSSMSLDSAVALSRDSCYLKYLNGAAPVVYGVPVYLS